jgi:ABC-type multidrug transport system fused ATPase/permease subunit
MSLTMTWQRFIFLHRTMSFAEYNLTDSLEEKGFKSQKYTIFVGVCMDQIVLFLIGIVIFLFGLLLYLHKTRYRRLLDKQTKLDKKIKVLEKYLKDLQYVKAGLELDMYTVMQQKEVEQRMEKTEKELRIKKKDLADVDRKIEEIEEIDDIEVPHKTLSLPKPDKEVIGLITVIIALITAIIRLIKS